jgi:hypothetical protein
MAFSNSSPLVARKLIGLKFCWNCASLLGFDKVITFASFQDDGKGDSGMQ